MNNSDGTEKIDNIQSDSDVCDVRDSQVEIPSSGGAKSSKSAKSAKSAKSENSAKSCCSNSDVGSGGGSVSQDCSCGGRCGGGHSSSCSCGGHSDGRQRRGCLGTIFAVLGLIFSTAWILNFSCGIVEIPDNLPLVGNLDEAFFTMLFLGCLSYLGIEIPVLTNLLKRNIKK